MARYPAEYNQIRNPGYVPPDLYNANQGNRGETSWNTRERLDMEHGRRLAGFGDYDGDSSYDDGELRRLEKSDDTYGSGIFDAAGSKPTVHPDLGVFQDHPNIPGYIGREVQFLPSKEVKSIPSGADVIVIPGGGMSWGGRIIPSGMMGQKVPYRYGSAIKPPPGVPRGKASVPTTPSTTAQATVPGPILPFRPAPVVVRAYAVAPTPSVTYYTMRRAGTSGFGVDPPPAKPSWVPYVAGGVMLGAAIAIFRGVLKQGGLKKGRA